ncbi:hypothetical protein OUZ56_033648 [Daphnia magna]|uniref:Uncharacterized protein n=1 Tax=Daphnia magna TaxID=35525 RepID=A0ABR0BAZ8_9CRUS|nr:hypothetical protein OUZ56_012267 [Daphnia magna]KAK4045747.1 hypothetical protein OUZ56_033648 [Daphnia magna]
MTPALSRVLPLVVSDRNIADQAWQDILNDPSILNLDHSGFSIDFVDNPVQFDIPKNFVLSTEMKL